MRWTQWVTPRRSAVLAGAWVAFQGVFAWAGSMAPNDAGPPPDFLVFANAAELRATLEALTEGGRAAYVRTCAIDMVYPLVYGGLLLALLTLLSRQTPRARWLTLLPVPAVFFDYVENVSFLMAIDAWPSPGTSVLVAGALSNSLKWTFAGLSVLGVLALVARRAFTRPS